jgi:hypothetical protein
VLHACDLSIWEVEAGGSLVQGQLGCIAELCLEKEGKKGGREERREREREGGRERGREIVPSTQ